MDNFLVEVAPALVGPIVSSAKDKNTFHFFFPVNIQWR